MDGFITVAIAHDATCKKGDEWVFHGMSADKETDYEGEEDKPITEEEIEDAKIGCFLFIVAVLAGIGFGIYYLIAH